MINRLHKQEIVPFPYERTYSERNIFKFLKENLKVKPKINKESSIFILKQLKKTVRAKRKNLEKLVENRKFDRLLVVIDSDYDSLSEETAVLASQITERLNSLGINTVLSISYDLFQQGAKRIRSISLAKGDIFLFAGKEMVKYTGKRTVLRLLRWIESKAETKFILPELPQIPVSEHEEYYRKAAEMEETDEFEVDEALRETKTEL